jgi:uncharacterized protein
MDDGHTQRTARFFDVMIPRAGTTTIGRSLKNSRSRLAAAAVFGLASVAADFAVILWGGFALGPELRWAIALLTLAALVRLVEGDVASLGLSVTPAQGWGRWIRNGILIGLAVAACIGVSAGAWVLSGRSLPLRATAPRDAGERFWSMAVLAPLKEEAIYRLGLCVPLTAWLGPRAAIAASGVVFGVLHIVYGNPSPENLVGGFFLAWAYLKSEAILVPVLLHAVGNLWVLAGQIGYWAWLHGGT